GEGGLVFGIIDDVVSYDGISVPVVATLSTTLSTISAEGTDTIFGNITTNGTVSGSAVMGIIGGTGADTITESSSFGLRFYGGAGNDSIFGNGGSDRAWGGSGNDVLTGESLYGDDGDDMLTAAAQGQLAGGAGNDVMYGGAQQTTALPGAGDDTVFGAAALSYRDQSGPVIVDLAARTAISGGTDTFNELHFVTGGAGDDT